MSEPRTAVAPSAPAARWAALLAVVAFSLGPSASARPSRMPAPEESWNPYAWPSLDELVERSDAIVAGEVVGLRSAWTADRQEIFTTVTLRPDRRLTGAERSLVRFRVPGGTVGDTRLTVTHVPVFSIGEAALVFLAGGSGRLPRVVGGEAGKRRLRTGEDGKELIVPGFVLSGAGDGGMTELNTLDDLAGALPRLLAATRSQ